MKNTFGLKVAAFLALIAVLTYFSVVVAPEPMAGDESTEYALAR
jgi:hypothetical protein